jgi:hypothetical protein
MTGFFYNRVLKNIPLGKLFKNAQMQGAQKTEERGVYRNTSGEKATGSEPEF